MEKENLHGGHRDRLRARFSDNPESFSDHELLELLLCYSLPRINTNEAAHRLIDCFGSLSAVFGADVQTLNAVSGIGEKTACFIKCVGAIIEREKKEENVFPKAVTPSEYGEYFIKRFADTREEYFIFLFIDSKQKVFRELTITQKRADNVIVDLSQLSREIALSKPNAIVCAHNHPSDNPSPSADDVYTTKQIALIANLSRAAFFDHLIVSGSRYYSFFGSGELDKIKKECCVTRLIKY